jgi:hypothetical protein
VVQFIVVPGEPGDGSRKASCGAASTRTNAPTGWGGRGGRAEGAPFLYADLFLIKLTKDFRPADDLIYWVEAAPGL